MIVEPVIQMRFHLALYDASYLASDGSFWTWRDPAVPTLVLDRCYYEVVIQDRPQDPARIGATDLWGGAAVLDASWACVYRFAHGGRDSHGRPGRLVVVVALFATPALASADLLTVISSNVVQTAAAQAAVSCPVQPPASLVLDWPTMPRPATDAPTTRRFVTGRLTFAGPSAARDALAAFVATPPAERWACRFHVVGGVGDGVLRRQSAQTAADRPAATPSVSTRASRGPARPEAMPVARWMTPIRHFRFILGPWSRIVMGLLLVSYLGIVAVMWLRTPPRATVPPRRAATAPSSQPRIVTTQPERLENRTRRVRSSIPPH